MNHPVHNIHNHTPFSDGAYTIDELCDAHLACKSVEFDAIGIELRLKRKAQLVSYRAVQDVVRYNSQSPDLVQHRRAIPQRGTLRLPKCFRIDQRAKSIGINVCNPFFD